MTNSFGAEGLDVDGLHGHGLDRDLDIAEVSRIAGLTSRTLRHYDAIGLVRPARTRTDGRRLYGRTELLRLQRVLILRTLGLPLERIAAVLDEDTDELAALQQHRSALLAEQGRLTDLLVTVDRTISHLEGGADMAPEDVFAGLPGYDAALQQAYEAEARERWGDEAVDASRAATASLSRDDAADVMAEHADVSRALAEAAARGASPADADVQALIARHHAWVSTFWTPDADAYVGLAHTYVDDPRFRATYDAFGDGTAVLLRDAIEVYAQTSMR
jgi:DNA-binding transcriptional MerR regulator